MAALVEPTAARWFTPAFVTANPPALDRVRAMIRDTPAADSSPARALQRDDFREDVEAIRLPMLLVVGAADGAVPAVMRGMHEAIPGSAFVGIEWAGHLPNIERADAFNAAIGTFLRS